METRLAYLFSGSLEPNYVLEKLERTNRTVWLYAAKFEGNNLELFVSNEVLNTTMKTDRYNLKQGEFVFRLEFFVGFFRMTFSDMPFFNFH